MKLSRLQVDQDAIRSGRWFDTGWGGFAVKVASIKTPGFAEEATAILRQHDLKDMESDEALAVLAPVVAKFLLVDWRGLEEDDGTPIPYSREKAVEILCNERLDHVVGFVLSKAQAVAEFFATSSEDAAKN